jgi:hypothetical protein
MSDSIGWEICFINRYHQPIPGKVACKAWPALCILVSDGLEN